MKHKAAESRQLILAGNPNVGKSVVFQALTGMYAEVSNYPGTTVDVTCGRLGPFQVIDTPGVFSLSGYNDEEQVTLDAVRTGHCILNVLDACNLSRDLFLTLQLLSLGKPVILAVNQMDAAERNGIRIDFSKLSEALSVPVFALSAKKGTGIYPLRQLLLSGKTPPPPHRASEKNDFTSLRLEADRLAASCVKTASLHKRTFSSELSRLLLNPLIGIPFTALFLGLFFFFVGNFLAQQVVGFTQGVVMEQWYYPFIYGLFSPIINPDSLLGSLLIGEYGLLTMVPVYLFGLLLPLIIGFYLSMSLLEDSGLLPRLAVLCDRLFTRFGLNGKAVIPMLLGFGCVTMALMTTRILGTKRERLIAAVLLCIAVPCSAQFAVILTVASALPPYYLFLYTGCVLSVFFLLGSLLNRFLPGTGSDLLLALPPLRLPGLKNVLQKTALKSKHFLLDAGPMFAVGSIIISLLFYTGAISWLHRILLPILDGLLGLPPEAAVLFLLSLIKRDLGAAYFYSMVAQGLLSFSQMTVALVVMTFFAPCFASLAVLIKERGLLTALAIWTGSLLCAFTAGGLMARLLHIL